MSVTVRMTVQRDSYNTYCDHVKFDVTIGQDSVTFNVDNDRDITVSKNDMVMLAKLLKEDE